VLDDKMQDADANKIEAYATSCAVRRAICVARHPAVPPGSGADPSERTRFAMAEPAVAQSPAAAGDCAQAVAVMSADTFAGARSRT
jgi:hypothetical protein